MASLLKPFLPWATTRAAVRCLKTSSISANKFVMVERTTAASGKHSVAVISLNRPPVNSFNIAFAEEFSATLQGLEQSGSADAIIVRSSLPTVFSAGLDLNDLYNKPRPHLEEFWRHVQNIWLQLYASRLPTVAAINGHCLAAGTIIAAACDHRVAASGDYKMGVSAAVIGVVAPPWFLTMLTHLIGQRPTEAALQQATLFSPTRAKAIGLVDEVCEPDMLEAHAFDALTPYLSVSAESRSTMKLSLRRDLINSFLASRDQDTVDMVSFLERDSVQRNIGEYMERLKHTEM